MTGAREERVSEATWEIIEGAYDMHVHVKPDLIKRRTDDVDLAHDFLAQGLAGFVLKSHYQPTAERAAVVRRAVPGIGAYGAVVLNHGVGGLNPVAVDVAGRSGARIVWLPTVDAANEADAARKHSGTPHAPMWVTIQQEMVKQGWLPKALSVLDGEGRMVSQALDCLAAAAEHGMIVATGHLDRREIYAVVKAARKLNVAGVIVTHPLFPAQALSAEEQTELADMGAWMEHCYTTPYKGMISWEDLFDSVRAVGSGRCIISTDLGQTKNPPVAEGMADFARRLLDAGFSVEEVRTMCVRNPERLLNAEIEATGRRRTLTR